MSRRISIEFVGEAKDFVRSTDAVSKAANQAGDDFDKLGTRASDMTDHLDSKMSGATASLGALSSGFELVGADKYAEQLQGAAMATDFFSGIGQGLTLILETNTFATLKAKAATIASAVASRAAAAGQWLLNAALSANPIGLAVAALAALAAGLVLAYKKSETFRHVVQAAFHLASRAARVAFDFITSKASAALGWIKANWPKVLAVLTGPIGLAVLAIAKNWDRIKAGASGVKQWVVDRFNSLIGFFHDLPSRVTSAVGGMWDGLKSGFRNAINAIIGWWNNLSFSINIPDAIPGLPDSFTISTPNVPMLAKGGVVTRPTLAVIGERGPEAVIPLDRLDTPRRTPPARGETHLHVHLEGPVYGDPRAFARYVREELLKLRRQEGGGALGFG